MGKQRVSCNDGHIGIKWTHPGECPLCACFDRIRELEAEVYVVREASDNWRECSEDWCKRAEKAEAENARLREAGDAIANSARKLTWQPLSLRHYIRQWDEAKRGTHG